MNPPVASIISDAMAKSLVLATQSGGVEAAVPAHRCRREVVGEPTHFRQWPTLQHIDIVEDDQHGARPSSPIVPYQLQLE